MYQDLKYCSRCGSPMVIFKTGNVRYRSTTGKKEFEEWESICSGARGWTEAILRVLGVTYKHDCRKWEQQAD